MCIFADPDSEFKNGDIILASSPAEAPVENIMGRIQVYGNSSFGSVCSNLFDNKAATVVCQQLGHVDGG